MRVTTKGVLYTSPWRPHSLVITGSVATPRSVPSACGWNDQPEVAIWVPLPVLQGVGLSRLGVSFQLPSMNRTTSARPEGCAWLLSASVAPVATHRVEVHKDRNAHQWISVFPP